MADEFVNVLMDFIDLAFTGGALIYAGRQIESQNRQAIFDKRMTVFQLLKGLEGLKQEDYENLTCDKKLKLLLSNQYLNQFDTIDEKIVQADQLYDSVDLLWKRRWITRHHNRHIRYAKDFIKAYLTLIHGLYNCKTKSKICLQEGYKYNVSDNIETYERIFFAMHETLYKDHINKIKDSIRI